MAGAPRFKVFDKYGEYLAACKRPEEAAAIVALLGNGQVPRVAAAAWRILTHNVEITGLAPMKGNEE